MDYLYLLMKKEDIQSRRVREMRMRVNASGFLHHSTVTFTLHSLAKLATVERGWRFIEFIY